MKSKITLFVYFFDSITQFDKFCEKKYDKIHKTNEKILKLPKIEQKIESLGMKWIYLK